MTLDEIKDKEVSQITFNEKRFFTNTSLVDPNQNTQDNTSKPSVVPVMTNSSITNTTTTTIKVKSIPPQNKYNNSEVNVSPLIQRNLQSNSHVPNLSLAEEPVREKALNLNSTSYFPSKMKVKIVLIKEKTAENNFNKYDMQQPQIPTQTVPQMFPFENNVCQ
jgi:hypothetical protein